MKSIIFKFALLILFMIGFDQLLAFDSRFLSENDDISEIKTYFPKHLNNLREAVPPRMIRYVDSVNYQNYGHIMVTGVLFTYKNMRARNVSIVVDRNHFKPIAMRRNQKGVWYYIWEPGYFGEKSNYKSLRYKFLVDGLFTYDETHNNRIEDGANSYISRYYFVDSDFKARLGTIVINEDVAYGRKVL